MRKITVNMVYMVEDGRVGEDERVCWGDFGVRS